MASLIDDIVLRTPGVRITGTDGPDMELPPRPVDVTVESPLGEGAFGHDARLDAAVKSLLADIPARC